MKKEVKGEKDSLLKIVQMQLCKNFTHKKKYTTAKKCIALLSYSPIIFLIFFEPTTGGAVKDEAMACVG